MFNRSRFCSASPSQPNPKAIIDLSTPRPHLAPRAPPSSYQGPEQGQGQIIPWQTALLIKKLAPSKGAFPGGALAAHLYRRASLRLGRTSTIGIGRRFSATGGTSSSSFCGASVKKFLRTPPVRHRSKAGRKTGWKNRDDLTAGEIFPSSSAVLLLIGRRRGLWILVRERFPPRKQMAAWGEEIPHRQSGNRFPSIGLAPLFGSGPTPTLRFKLTAEDVSVQPSAEKSTRRHRQQTNKTTNTARGIGMKDEAARSGRTNRVQKARNVKNKDGRDSYPSLVRPS